MLNCGRIRGATQRGDCEQAQRVVGQTCGALPVRVASVYLCVRCKTGVVVFWGITAI
jgi:hypothetical protein